MPRDQRVFSREFKLEVCKKIASGEVSKTHTMRHHKLGAGTVERWMEQYELRGREKAFDGNPWRVPERAESKETQLQKEIEQLKLENEFLRACLGKSPEQADKKWN